MVESQRLKQRTRFDIEMIIEWGYYSGIENHSRHLSGLEGGVASHSLFDYLLDDALLIIDKSHVMIPRIGTMYEGDRSRKLTIVDYGFWLLSVLDNRPLKFKE